VHVVVGKATGKPRILGRSIFGVFLVCKGIRWLTFAGSYTQANVFVVWFRLDFRLGCSLRFFCLHMDFAPTGFFKSGVFVENRFREAPLWLAGTEEQTPVKL